MVSLKEFQTNVKENREQFLKSKQAYLDAIDANNKMLKIDEKIKTKVLKEHVFTDSEGNRIVDGKREYRIAYNPKFKEYLKLCNQERIKLGINIPEEFVTNLHEQEQLVKSENDFIATALSLLPISLKNDLEKGVHTNYMHRQKFIELTLQLKV